MKVSRWHDFVFEVKRCSPPPGVRLFLVVLFAMMAHVVIIMVRRDAAARAAYAPFVRVKQ